MVKASYNLDNIRKVDHGCGCENCKKIAPFSMNNQVGFFKRPFLGMCLAKDCRDYKEEKLDIKLDKKRAQVDRIEGKTEANLLLAQQGIDGTSMDWLGTSLSAVSQAVMGIFGGGAIGTAGGGLGGIFSGGTNTSATQQQEQQRQMLIIGGVAVVFIIILIAVFGGKNK